MRTTLILSILGIACLAALGGCSGGVNNAASAPAADGVASPHATHDPIADYNQYRTTSQLAAGLLSAGMVAEEVKNYYEIHDKLPSSNVQAGAVDTRRAAKFDGPGGGPAGSVSIGPAAGVITVTWASGVLAGKTLVLLPVRMKRDPYLCWKVGAATTLRGRTLANANIVDLCAEDEREQLLAR